MLDINRFKSQIQKYDVERPNLFTTYIYMPIDMPKSIQQYMSKLYDPIMLFAQSVNAPGMQITTAPVKRYGLGPNQLMPTGVEVNNTVNVTYIADGSARLFTFFYLWLNHITPLGGTKFAAGVPNETQKDGETVEIGNPSFILPYQSSYVSQIDIRMYRGTPGKFNGSGLGSLALSLATSALGVPFVGSLLNGIDSPEFDLEPMRQVVLHKAFPIAISEMPLSMGSADTFSTFTVTFAYYKWELRVFEEKQAEDSKGGLFGGLL